MYKLMQLSMLAQKIGIVLLLFIVLVLMVVLISLVKTTIQNKAG